MNDRPDEFSAMVKRLELIMPLPEGMALVYLDDLDLDGREKLLRLIQGAILTLLHRHRGTISLLVLMHEVMRMLETPADNVAQALRCLRNESRVIWVAPNIGLPE